MTVLGIDVGGTKTVCLLADADGHVLAEGRGEGANLQGAGELALEKALHAVIERTVGQRDTMADAICLGIAGVDRVEDEIVVRGIMNRIARKAKILVVNDALIALQAGVGSAPGVVIVSGTGSIAYGRNRRGEAARAGGWGYVLGDEGSGYWIGRLALRAVVRHADGRGRPTSLTPLLLAHFDATHAGELIHRIYQEAVPPRVIAEVARYVERAHGEGDGVGTSILDRAADELVTAAAAVISKLELEDEPFDVVLSGGMFFAIPSLCVRLERLISGRAARAKVRRLDVEPALGAVQLALAELRGAFQLPVYRESQS